MESIEALVANILGLSECKTTQLHTLLKQSEDSIRSMSSQLGRYLDELDPKKHSLGYLFLLEAYLSTPAAKEQAEIIPSVARFINSCVAEQIRLEPRKFTYICKVFMNVVVQCRVPIMGVAPLRRAVQKLQPSSGDLTALHSMFLHVCLLARLYKTGNSILKENIFEDDQPRNLFLCCYYGGMICIGQKQFRKAIQLLHNDTDLGLVDQVVSSLYKCNIQRLTQDIANTVQLNTPKEVKMRVRQMIEDGEIFATIYQKDGTVSFFEGSEQYKSCEMTENIDSSIQRIMSLSEKLNSVHEGISCDPGHLPAPSIQAIAWGTTISGIANKCGKFVGADSRSENCSNGNIDDFSYSKVHKISDNLIALNAGCTAWSIPIITELQMLVFSGVEITARYCASYAQTFFKKKNYKPEKKYFLQIPENLDIEKEKCGLLFVGYDGGKTQMFYVNNEDNKVVEIVELPCLKENQQGAIVRFGTGATYLYEHISDNEWESIYNGKEGPDFYCKLMLKMLRSSALKDENSGGFGKVCWINEGCVFEFEEELLSYPIDFNAWVALIQESETAAIGNLSRVEAVYDAFLTKYPMSVGYWIKYAEQEARLAPLEEVVDKVKKVYERAIKFTAYSVDIWLHYCRFAVSEYDAESVRRLFQRALLYVGTDYTSYPLWDAYIKYEYSQKEMGHVVMIFKKVLALPIRYLGFLYRRFTRNGKKLADAEWEKHKEARNWAYKILKFEKAIKTRYFHASHPDESELATWEKYLDFVESEGDSEKVIVLYERCLIACAKYPEFWIRYANSMQNGGRLDLAYHAIERATLIFDKRESDFHLFRARFYDKNLILWKARAAYQLVHSEISPNHREAMIEQARFELRQGDWREAFDLLERANPTELERGLKEMFVSLMVDEVEHSRDRFDEVIFKRSHMLEKKRKAENLVSSNVKRARSTGNVARAVP